MAAAEAAAPVGGQKRPRLAKLAAGLEAAGTDSMPMKKYFRQRAHCNPFNAGMLDDIAPKYPSDMDWARLFPTLAVPGGHGAISKPVEIADVGCGFGGLLFGLAQEPATAPLPAVGMEIRLKVSEYVRVRIAHFRREGGDHDNIAVVRSNAMRYFPHYFAKGQLSKVFTCFPDPHFKRAKHDRRIVSQALLADYAYCIRPGGHLYIITDVYDLYVWMRVHGETHTAFRRLTPQQEAADPAVAVMHNSTEEGKKVARDKRMKYVAVFQRTTDAEAEELWAARGLWGQPDPVALYDAEMEAWRASGAADAANRDTTVPAATAAVATGEQGVAPHQE